MEVQLKEIILRELNRLMIPNIKFKKELCHRLFDLNCELFEISQNMRSDAYRVLFQLGTSLMCCDQYTNLIKPFFEDMSLKQQKYISDNSLVVDLYTICPFMEINRIFRTYKNKLNIVLRENFDNETDRKILFDILLRDGN